MDRDHFYAVNNRVIGKYDKRTGVLVKKWQGDKDGPIEHLDSAMVMDGKIYAAHSNYPKWPMTSSVEIFDAATAEAVDEGNGIDGGVGLGAVDGGLEFALEADGLVVQALRHKN